MAVLDVVGLHVGHARERELRLRAGLPAQIDDERVSGSRPPVEGGCGAHDAVDPGAVRDVDRLAGLVARRVGEALGMLEVVVVVRLGAAHVDVVGRVGGAVVEAADGGIRAVFDGDAALGGFRLGGRQQNGEERRQEREAEGVGLTELGRLGAQVLSVKSASEKVLQMGFRTLWKFLFRFEFWCCFGAGRPMAVFLTWRFGYTNRAVGAPVAPRFRGVGRIRKWVLEYGWRPSVKTASGRLYAG